LSSGTLWLHDIANMEYDADGTPVRMIGTVQDITDRKRTQEGLQESEQRYRSIYESSPVGISNVDTTGKFVRVNKAMQDILGYPETELLGRSFNDFTFAEDKGIGTREMQELLEGRKELAQFEKRYVRKDSKVTWAHLTISAVRDSRRNLLYTVTIAEDVTERKRADKALRESEERYKSLVETLPDGVIVHSEGRVVFANSACARIIGAASPVDLIGRPILDSVHPDSRELAMKRIGTSLREGVPLPTAEEIFVRMDGTPINVEVSAVPISYSAKPSMLTVFNDITERKEAEKTVQETVRELQRWQDLMLDRQDRTQELKREVNKLCGRAGETLRYPSVVDSPVSSETGRPNS
jgi:PAS domain S-box-containing protein